MIYALWMFFLIIATIICVKHTNIVDNQEDTI